MNNWRETPLIELGRFSSGKSIKPGLKGPYPAFGSNGLIGQAADWRYRQGVVVGRVGAYCGSVAISRGPFWASDNTIVVEPIEASDLDFLYYLLLDANLNQHAGGAAQPLVTQTTLKNLRFRVPGPRGRAEIGAVLRAIDDLIENNRRQVDMLKEMARSIYREWFVNFRYPGHEDVPLADSTLGPIPSGWSALTISDVLRLHYGRALTKQVRRGGRVAVVSSAGIVGWHDKALVTGPSIVVGRKGNVGSVTWVDGDSWPIDTAYFVETDLPMRYVVEQLRGTEFVNTHAAVPGLSREQAYGRPFLRPPMVLMHQFDDLSRQLGTQASVLMQAAERLTAIRDLLLPNLITGRIDIPQLDLNVLVEAAVA